MSTQPRLILEMSALVTGVESPIQRRLRLGERFAEDDEGFSEAFLCLTALEFVAEQLGPLALERIRGQNRAAWMAELARAEAAAVTPSMKRRKWPAAPRTPKRKPAATAER